MRNNIIQTLMSIRNPNQLKNRALDMLARQNPQLAGTLKMMMTSGKSPKEALAEMVQAGKVTKTQFDQIKRLYSQYGRFLPFQIPKREFDNMEQVFTNQTMPSATTTKTGFHF